MRGGLAALTLGWAIATWGCAPNLHWQQDDAAGVTASGVRGALGCTPGETDCNVCAHDVRAQLAADGWRVSDESWGYDGAADYDGLTPGEAYNALPRGHAQGFVRTNHIARRYAMVHSYGLTDGDHRRVATLSLFDKPGAGRGALTDLRDLRAHDGHTSGAFVLGRWIGLFQRDGVLMLLDAAGDARQLVHLPADEEATYKERGASPRSGGVAMAKLADGRYLLVANEGGDGPSSGHSHFTVVDGSLSAPSWSTRYLGEYRYTTSAVGRDDFHHSENLAVITECDTGDLYTVHVGSSGYRGMLHRWALAKTFWRVSQLVWSGREDETPELVPVGVFTRRSDMGRCWGRGAGSAHATLDGKLELLCHARFVLPPAAWPYARQHRP